MIKLLFFILFLTPKLCAVAEFDDIGMHLCTAEFCKESNIAGWQINKLIDALTFASWEYVKTNPCPKLPTACNIQNATHSGIILSFAGPCNCCKFCLENLALGADCVSQSIDGAIPSVICGDGLYCDQTTKKCVINPSKCNKELQNYEERKENGQIGHLELPPKCDKNGDYRPVKCIPGESCFCADKDGDRIFGTFPYNVQADDLNKCACSRNVVQINKVLGTDKFSSKRAKCLTDGDFNPIQCLSDKCTCVHTSDGGLVNLKQIPVNIHLISKLPCFDPILHNNGSYLNNCEKKHIALTKKVDDLKKKGFNGVIGIQYPFCQIDGRYSSVQETKTLKYCADPDGKKIENFEIKKTDSLSFNMNCNCARVQSIITHFEKPSCCANGNYQCIQCRRGKCRCVDRNGIQTKKEVDFIEKDTLKCQKCDRNNCTL